MAKNKTNSIVYGSDALMTPLRLITIFAVVISAYDVGQAIMSFAEYMSMPDIDMFLVTLWLLSAPMSFGACVLFFYAAKSIAEGKGADMAVILAFAMMIIASVSSLISEQSILTGDGLSIIILCAIVLVCYAIGFLYYQRIGSKPLALFGAIMSMLCAIYYLINGVRLVMNEPSQLMGYLFTSYVTAFMVSLVYLFVVLSLKNGIDTETKE